MSTEQTNEFLKDKKENTTEQVKEENLNRRKIIEMAAAGLAGVLIAGNASAKSGNNIDLGNIGPEDKVKKANSAVKDKFPTPNPTPLTLDKKVSKISFERSADELQTWGKLRDAIGNDLKFTDSKK